MHVETHRCGLFHPRKYIAFARGYYIHVYFKSWQKLRVSDATSVHTCTISLNTGMSFIVTTSNIVVYTSQPYQTTVIVFASHRSG